MIKTIIKRDGRREPFIPSKLNGWGEWAARALGPELDWSSVVLETVTNMPEECSSAFLQQQLIKNCLYFDSWSYNRMAGRLYMALVYKDVFNGQIPTVLDLHRKLQGLGYMELLAYSEQEYAQVEDIVDHSRDFEYAHYQIHTHLSKYAIADRVNSICYETPQFIYMRMAMALSVDQPHERRMHDVARFYEHLSHNRINAPTPNHINLGTPLRGYASCCLYAAGDTARSIAVGNHIANTMTYMSAGIGSYLQTRSLNDAVRGGVIRHQGKLPYLRAIVSEVKANLQNGRGGACTSYFSIFDPEIDTLLRLKNPMSTEDKKIRGMDYSWGGNRFFARKVAKNENVFLFNCHTAPDLYDALYSDDEARFEALYEKYANDAGFPKTWVNARELLLTASNEWNETGRVYEHNLFEMNRHTPFKDTIYSSNLCSEIALPTAPYNHMSEIYQARDISFVHVETTAGEELKLPGNAALETRQGMRYAYEIAPGDEILHLPAGTQKLDRTVAASGSQAFQAMPASSATVGGHTLNAATLNGEPASTQSSQVMHSSNATVGGHMVNAAALNGEPASTQSPHAMAGSAGQSGTSDADSITIARVLNVSSPEVATCNLAGIVISHIESEEQYADVAYYALLMIDKCIHLADYELPHVGFTSKARLNAGVGILGLAHLMAKNQLLYTSPEGKKFIHRVAERHYYHLLRASLRLGQELGNALWIHRSRWPQGWLPFDTHNRNVDRIADFDTHYDWEALRQEIIANGGIRNSVLVAHMPTETSANASGTTNGVYPIRELTMIKTDNQRVNYWAAPDGDALAPWYESAWDIPAKDLTEVYAILQKWTDQGISADFYRKVIGDATIKSTEMIQNYLYRVQMGLKSKYYMNQKTSAGLRSAQPTANDGADVPAGNADVHAPAGAATAEMSTATSASFASAPAMQARPGSGRLADQGRVANKTDAASQNHHQHLGHIDVGASAIAVSHDAQDENYCESCTL